MKTGLPVTGRRMGPMNFRFGFFAGWLGGEGEGGGDGGFHVVGVAFVWVAVLGQSFSEAGFSS